MSRNGIVLAAASVLLIAGWKIGSFSALTRQSIAVLSPSLYPATSFSGDDIHTVNSHGLQISYKQDSDYTYFGFIRTEDGKVTAFHTNSDGTYIFGLPDGNRFVVSRDGQHVPDATQHTDPFIPGTYHRSMDEADADFPKMCRELQTLGL